MRLDWPLRASDDVWLGAEILCVDLLYLACWELVGER